MSRQKKHRPSLKSGRRKKYALDTRRSAYRLRKESGFLNEERLVRLLNDPQYCCPPWLGTTQLSSESQDRQGIDVIVMTDIGPVFIDVKSSEVFAKRFHDRRQQRLKKGQRTLRIGTVIVHDGLSDGVIVKEALRKIKQLRDLRMQHGKFVTPTSLPD